ncbi:HNH endonuclease [Peptostreptococcus canis]|uniref:HNH endonuclease n=1 Tax=Peptostreptococcus canis TaxID=1159213 RepID=A0ABR6TIF6_9FIRM|nr:HNH endonuclease [Peptostreptococcus canis]
MKKSEFRPDRGAHRTAYEKNRKRILKTDSICGICGKPVDKTLKPPHPLSPCIDHIIPLSKGGHPSDINNLQLAHSTCNRQKSDKMLAINRVGDKDINIVLSNRNLPKSIDWVAYGRKNNNK